ncbi:MAG: nicotinate-nicotinamide nucleotide adenylyltransferase, partial [Chloroflexi bacterium]|nr:nicotinate-nicotinamide nucleotide adenylyltransferase [Chloroflexota bacterium]
MGLTGTTTGGPGARRPWGILGGTFDPIHLGHLAVAEQTRQDLDLAGVLFIPAAQSPLKPDRPVSPGTQRVAMVELAITGNEGFRVSRMELDRPGPSYTVDTLLALHAAGTITGEGVLDPVLILSVETLPGLVHWREPERLLDVCRVAIVPVAATRARSRVGSRCAFRATQTASRCSTDPTWVHPPRTSGGVSPRAAPSGTWCRMRSPGTSLHTGCMAQTAKLGDDDLVIDEQPQDEIESQPLVAEQPQPIEEAAAAGVPAGAEVPVDEVAASAEVAAVAAVPA